MVTPVRIFADHTEVDLPSGKTVAGYPQGSPEQAETARRLGYGDEVLALVLDHDPLHARLCDWLGIPASYSLRMAAGELPDSERHLAEAEEEAVIAVQRFMRMASRSNDADHAAPSPAARHANQGAG